MKQIPVVQPSSAPPVAQESGMPARVLTPDPVKTEELKPGIVQALSTVYDPEIPVNIYELGLVYDIVVDAAGAANIRMTLTAPACPAAQYLPQQVKERVAAVPGVTDVTVEVVWDPPWDRERMSEAARLQLGLW